VGCSDVAKATILRPRPQISRPGRSKTNAKAKTTGPEDKTKAFNIKARAEIKICSTTESLTT